MPKELEKIRMKLWCDAWVATANSDSCLAVHTATRYADKALEEFDERFKARLNAPIGD